MSLFLLAALAAAAPLDPPALVHVEVTGRAGSAVLLFTNPDPRAPAMPQSHLRATMRGGGRDVPVDLVADAPAAVPPGGFVRATYRFAVPPGQPADAQLLLGDVAVALTIPTAPMIPAEPTRVADAAAPPAAPSVAVADVRPGNSYIANLETYNPIYAVYGPGTASAAKLQLSFQYQLFGDADHPTGDWKEGLRFGYTQRMFWDIEAESAPFRDVNYRPELFYRYRLAKPWRGAALALQGGVLHESNGRGGTASRGYNIVYVEPQAVFPIGGMTATVAPRVMAYVGALDDNPDIARYRGHTALAVSIGRDDGFKLSAVSRYSFGSGRGAIDGELTYPMKALTGLPVYLVVQGFRGYGEDLRDYDRRQTRVRLGIGVVR